MTALASAGAPARLGKYEILSALAAGGMARLYIARTTGIGSFERHVVLKTLLPERAHDEMSVGMFLDEARLAASLHHGNVAQVFEVGEEDGVHYLAMEYVHGQDLRALLAKAGATGTKIPLDLALTILTGAAAGLHHAHERRGPDGVPLGIVHRDVSPSNVMVAYDGAVKLLDFGIAKATSRTIETQSGVIKGKFAYMSPEQCRGRNVDARSDLFALGIILYEVTTQHRCFRAESDFDTMHRIVTGDTTRPSKLVPGYPPELEAIVMKALSVDPAQRYQDVGEMLEAMERYASSARLSLSTMALGRFMRELFGEVQEPWLTGHRASAPILSRESTISSTSGGGAIVSTVTPAPGVPTLRLPTGTSARVLRASEPPPTASTMSAMPLSALAQPSTIPDVPRAGDDGSDGPTSAEWNAKSYPASPPTLASGEHVAPVTTPFRKSGGHPVLAPAPRPVTSSSPPLPPVGLPLSPTTERGIVAGFTPAPPSGSNLSYPRYEPPPKSALDDEADAPKRKSRLPLYLALGAVAGGLVVALALGSGGGDAETPRARLAQTVANDVMRPHEEPATVPIVPPPVPTVAKTVAPVARPAVPAPSEADDDQITVHVGTEPPGADVSLDGKPIGTTPLDTKLHRGSGSVVLAIHREKFADVTTKLDLGGDFSKDVTLRPVGHHHETPAASPPPVAKKCQPAGQVNPFDTSCNGQPCPPCK